MWKNSFSFCQVVLFYAPPPITAAETGVEDCYFHVNVSSIRKTSQFCKFIFFKDMHKIKTKTECKVKWVEHYSQKRNKTC